MLIIQSGVCSNVKQEEGWKDTTTLCEMKQLSLLSKTDMYVITAPN